MSGDMYRDHGGTEEGGRQGSAAHAPPPTHSLVLVPRLPPGVCRPLSLPPLLLSRGTLFW